MRPSAAGPKWPHRPRFRRGLLWLPMLVALAAAASPLAAASPPTPPWLAPSGGPYPKLAGRERIWLRVSTERQRVYVMDGSECLYTMIASTGLEDPADDKTPEGTFYIQRERGLSFYSARLKEGARYWVSWLNHGEYLFHSVPTDSKGRIIEEEARKLGQEASHGCIRLSLPDAKWIYENIEFGTKVVIGP